jgi:hypothetical protein
MYALELLRQTFLSERLDQSIQQKCMMVTNHLSWRSYEVWWAKVLLGIVLPFPIFILSSDVEDKLECYHLCVVM